MTLDESIRRSRRMIRRAAGLAILANMLTLTLNVWIGNPWMAPLSLLGLALSVYAWRGGDKPSYR